MACGRIAGALAAGLAAFALALAAAPDSSTANDTGETAPALLQQQGRLHCRPAIRYFCRNIHISCSGQSDLRTEPFELRGSGPEGRLRFEDGNKEGLPSDGQLKIARGYVLLRLKPDADYLKVEADGRYSFRIYRNGVALMSHGTCS